jgi:hypothetical protein
MRFMYARGIGMVPHDSATPQCTATADCYSIRAPSYTKPYGVVVIDLVSTAEPPSGAVLVVSDTNGASVEFTATPPSVSAPSSTTRVVGRRVVYTFAMSESNGGKASNRIVRVRVHSSVDRAVFLWSDSAPPSTANL